MKTKLKKLDKRHHGFNYWKFYVEKPYVYYDTVYPNDGKILFFKWRTWCWENFGPSKEVESYNKDDLFDDKNCSNSRWAWMADYHNSRFRIYFCDDSTASIFSLRWLT